MSSPCRSHSVSFTSSMSTSSSSETQIDDEQPCCSRSLFTTVAPTPPVAHTAESTEMAAKRKLDEMDAPQEVNPPHRKRLRKTRHLTYPLTPECSPRAISPSSVETDTINMSEEELNNQIANFDIYASLSSLFGYPVHPPIDPEEEAIKNFNPDACLSSLFSCTARPLGSNTQKKRLLSIPARKGRSPASRSRKISDTGAFPTSNYMYQKWNICFLRKLQKEVYSAQQHISPSLLSRICSIHISPKPICKPIIHTTVRNYASHRLDWGKLQASLAYLSIQGEKTVGEEQAKQAVQRVSILCRKRKERINCITISGAKLTRWCAAALLAQEVSVNQELTNPPTTHLLGRRHFISGEHDTAAAHKDLEGFVSSRRAVSLLRRDNMNNPSVPSLLPEHSEDSPDSQDDS